MTRAEIEAEINNMIYQRETALKTAVQAEGAISALEWVLSKLDAEEISDD
jgi:hypothetical protein